MKIIQVYLGGPIHGKTIEEATSWRKTFTANLNHAMAISPTRFKGLDIKSTGDDIAGPLNYNYPKSVLSNSRAILTRDLMDIRRSDIVLMNFLETSQRYVGSFVEMGYAHALNIPVLLVIESNNELVQHPFVGQLASWIVPTLEDARYIVETTANTNRV